MLFARRYTTAVLGAQITLVSDSQCGLQTGNRLYILLAMIYQGHMRVMNKPKKKTKKNIWGDCHGVWGIPQRLEIGLEQCTPEDWSGDSKSIIPYLPEKRMAGRELCSTMNSNFITVGKRKRGNRFLLLR